MSFSFVSARFSQSSLSSTQFFSAFQIGRQYHKISESISKHSKRIRSYNRLLFHMDNSNIALFRIIFVSEPGNSVKTFDLYLSVDTNNRQVNLNPIFQAAIERGLNLRNAQLFHVDFYNKVNMFLGTFPLSQDIKVAQECLVNNSIQIIYKLGVLAAGEMIDEEAEEMENKKKTKKVKERTIQEAIKAVRLWREYYDTPDATGRRLYTLDEAAKKVGIAKKTLDDYYNHLRIAQQYEFNLQRYCEQKVGILRKFVKVAKEGGCQRLQKELPEFLMQTNIEKYWNKFSEL